MEPTDVSAAAVSKTALVLDDLRDAIGRNMYALYYVQHDIAASKGEVLHALAVALVVLEQVARERGDHGTDKPADNRVDTE